MQPLFLILSYKFNNIINLVFVMAEAWSNWFNRRKTLTAHSPDLAGFEAKPNSHTAPNFPHIFGPTIPRALIVQRQIAHLFPTLWPPSLSRLQKLLDHIERQVISMICLFRLQCTYSRSIPPPEGSKNGDRNCKSKQPLSYTSHTVIPRSPGQIVMFIAYQKIMHATQHRNSLFID